MNEFASNCHSAIYECMVCWSRTSELSFCNTRPLKIALVEWWHAVIPCSETICLYGFRTAYIGFTIWLYGCTDYPAAYPTLLVAEGFSINLALARSYLYHRFVGFLLSSPLILLKKAHPNQHPPVILSVNVCLSVRGRFLYLRYHVNRDWDPVYMSN